MDRGAVSRNVGNSEGGHRPLEKKVERATERAAAVFREAIGRLCRRPAIWRRWAVRLGLVILMAFVAWAVAPAGNGNGPRYLIAQRDVPTGIAVTSLHFGVVP